ncbi:putative OsmC-like protein [Cytobacillus firmus]|uniref:Putative OsmC-like protein n=2 Tax=Cytobacillus TaxID=2675230 RepID=A0A366JKB2_CYTFI|nr:MULTISPECIES: OsmC family protein [Cytobacillus]RBP86291.1 putative OsmC-like protein [Cytobacillus firmus]TDX35913.1 putative OsmC-like protein [Cytobacillus oceanisediminis]
MTLVAYKASSITEKKSIFVLTENHQYRIDEPNTLEGKEKGTNPLNTFLGALAASETIIANMIAEEINFCLNNIEFIIEGQIDPMGYKGGNLNPTFRYIIIYAELDTTESEDKIQELKKMTTLRCPILNIINSKKVSIKSIWNKKK